MKQNTVEDTQAGHFRKNWLPYLLLALLIGMSGFMWISNKRSLTQQQMAFEAEQLAQQQRTQLALDSLNNDQLTIMTKALVWAVRSELVRNNNEQVDQYFRQFVKTKGVQDVTLINDKGKVLLSTNKKVEGDLLEAPYLQVALASNDVLIIDEGPENLQLIGPVMSLNNRLGTLIVNYRRPVIHYQ